jgi:hypothetical protein
MNEEDLVEKYLKRVGSEVIDKYYYSGNLGTDTFPVIKYMGIGKVEQYEKCFFYGNISVNIDISGVVTLAGQNSLILGFVSEFIGGFTSNDFGVHMNIGNGINLLGDGTYMGSKRFYGVGFNRISFAVVDVAAAVFNVSVRFNGILFIMK